MSEQYGVMVGTVKAVGDPAYPGCVKVEFSWMGGKNESYWAPVAAPMAGGGRGAHFMPEVSDEVLVAFDRGDINHPYVIGYSWNGKDAPPSTSPRERMIRSVNGHAIRFLDTTPVDGDKGAVIIQDANGNAITMANGMITIHSSGVLVLDASTIAFKTPGGMRVIQSGGNPI